MVDLYPISITIVPSERPTPQIVPLATVRAWARRTGNPSGHRRDMAGITVPWIRPETRPLQFEERRHEGTAQFRYASGSLLIRTWHQVLISNTLSRCQQRIWTAHEFDHISDNHRAAGTLMLRLQTQPFMREFFLDRRWYDRNPETITRMASQFEETCARVYRQLTLEAAGRRDTPAEYDRIRQRIRATCGASRHRPPSRVRAEGRQ